MMEGGLIRKRKYIQSADLQFSLPALDELSMTAART